MRTNTAEKMMAYISKHKQVTPHELVVRFEISRQAVFKQLKKLKEEGKIDKKGSAPKTIYEIRRQKTLSEIGCIIVPILKDNDANFVGIFGSYARGEATEKSDVDILVDFSKQKTLLDIVGIEEDLSEALKVKVDMVLRKSLNPRIKPYVLNDLKTIYL